MNARRVLLRLVAFFAAFAAAVALVVLLAPAPRRQRYVPPPPRAFNIAEDIETDVKLVTMDRENKVTHTQLGLYYAGYGGLALEKLWVRTYFFTPGDPAARVWATDAVGIGEPFADGGRVTLTVTARCDWCDDEGVPAGGYFARVQISDGTNTTPLAWGPQFGDITTAAPVVVHAERAASRRPQR